MQVSNRGLGDTPLRSHACQTDRVGRDPRKRHATHAAALAEFHIVGVGNNIAFLARLIKHPAFQQGRSIRRLLNVTPKHCC